MNKVFQRCICLFLALLTVATLLPAAGLSIEAQAVADKDKKPGYLGYAETYEDVEAIVTDYYETISRAGKLYWNKNLGFAKMKTATYVSTVTNTGCHVPRQGTALANVPKESNTARRKKHKRNLTATKDGKTIYGCTSNLSKGVGTLVDNVFTANVKYSDAQCAGFAAYMSYVVFGVTTDWSGFTLCYGTGNNSLGRKVNNEIKPGSVMRYAGHSYFIYKVDDTYAYYIECNTGTQDCKIRFERKIELGELRRRIENCNAKAAFFSALLWNRTPRQRPILFPMMPTAAAAHRQHRQRPTAKPSP